MSYLINLMLNSATRVRRKNTPSAEGCRGSGFISILVTLSLIGIGLSGLMSLQMQSISDVRITSEMNLARLTAESMAERMYANSVSATAGGYKHTTDSFVTSANDCEALPCSSTDLASYDVTQWQQSFHPGLNEVYGEVIDITTDGKLWSVIVSWKPGNQAALDSLPCQATIGVKAGQSDYQCIVVDVAL